MNIKFNLSDTARLLAGLGASEKNCFQTFPDNRKLNRPGLTRILFGTLSEHAEELCELNCRGAGIFAVVNLTDGQGRRRENITALRAAFVDNDSGLLPDPAPLEFSAIVNSSPGKQHGYFFLSAGQPLTEFTPVQRIVAAHFGGDPHVCDLPRVMRLPGFNHMKDPSAPFLVQIVRASSTRYSLRDLISTYAREAHSSDGNVGLPNQNWLSIVTEGTTVGSRNCTLASLAGHLLRKNVHAKVALELLLSWNRTRNKERLPDSEVERTVNSIARAEYARRMSEHAR